jgi:hypothetical protein
MARRGVVDLEKLAAAHDQLLAAIDELANALNEPANGPSLVPMKRITITVSDALHRQIKMSCVARGINMADAVRDVLERTWPAKEREAA